MADPSRTTRVDFSGASNRGVQIGVNSGSITNNIHRHQDDYTNIQNQAHNQVIHGNVYHYERQQHQRDLEASQNPYTSPSPSPASPPPATSLLPFNRDLNFVDRAVLHDMLDRFDQQRAHIALVGLPGAGKTHLAIEFVHRIKDRVGGRVFWVQASSGTLFQKSYRNFAKRLQLNGWDKPDADVVELVHERLSNDTNGRWTVVVDGVDDADVLFDLPIGPTGTRTGVPEMLSVGDLFIQYLPSSALESLIFTSCSGETAQTLIERHEDILNIGPMEGQEAVSLLRKKLNRDQLEGVSEENLQLLAQNFDNLALPMVQVAKYLNSRTGLTTIPTSLEILETRDVKRNKFIRDVLDLKSDRQSSGSILKTWYSMFMQIGPPATRLMSLLSIFGESPIPRYLLEGKYDKRSRDGVENDFEDDIIVLKTYNLISIGTSASHFEMPSLIQFAIRFWLQDREALEYWEERVVDILQSEYPTDVHVNQLKPETLLPRVKAILSFRLTSEEHNRTRADLLIRGAHYSWQMGQVEEAEVMARTSLESRERLFVNDNDDDDILRFQILDILALILGFQDKYDEAIKMGSRALDGRQRVLGPMHPDTLACKSGLDTIYRSRDFFNSGGSFK